MSENSLEAFYQREKERTIDQCLQCGRCNRKCHILPHTELRDIPPQELQQRVIRFLETGERDEAVIIRALACMRCFQCVDGVCPQGLSPMQLNEIIRDEFDRQGQYRFDYPDPGSAESLQRIIASIQVSPREYTRILTPSSGSAGHVFFPGCNVYFQPDKLLSALDVMDRISGDYAFLPGLDTCCGDAYITTAQMEKGGRAADSLVDSLSAYKPHTVIFWCPTCLCNCHKIISHVRDIPFRTVSFPQFLAENADSLPMQSLDGTRVTLQEPCKSAFTGLDRNGARDLLHRTPGVHLQEMPRHGANTSCCGSTCGAFFPESFRQVRDARLREAESTGQDWLVDVCHYCHEVFADQEPEYDFTIVSYVSLIARALGMEREDKLKKFKQLGDIDRIIEEADELVRTSPFSEEQIRQALASRLSLPR